MDGGRSVVRPAAVPVSSVGQAASARGASGGRPPMNDPLRCPRPPPGPTAIPGMSPECFRASRRSSNSGTRGTRHVRLHPIAWTPRIEVWPRDRQLPPPGAARERSLGSAPDCDLWERCANQRPVAVGASRLRGALRAMVVPACGGRRKGAFAAGWSAGVAAGPSVRRRRREQGDARGSRRRGEPAVPRPRDAPSSIYMLTDCTPVQ